MINELVFKEESGSLRCKKSLFTRSVRMSDVGRIDALPESGNAVVSGLLLHELSARMIRSKVPILFIALREL